jgi:WD40 repeat protein
LDIAQSRELLASWANLPVAELSALADEVIAECGRLPLALSVVGAMLRSETAEFWADTLDLLRNADLSAIEEQLPEGQDSFFKAVEVSFQSLKPEMQGRYEALAVLVEDMAAPLPLLRMLWDVSDSEARRIGRQLVDRSLAQRAGADGGIRLHDLQLDYVRAHYPEKEALEMIRGAVRLSSNAITTDPSQFPSQMVGRLMTFQEDSAVMLFANEVVERASMRWLRPLHATLRPPEISLISPLRQHSGAVCSVALSGDGRLAISASWGGTVKVWDIGGGHELRTFTAHDLSVYGVALSGDGQLAVSVSEDRTLKVWEVSSSCRLRTLTGHTGPVTAVALSADGRLAVSASADQTLKVWDLKTGRELRTLTGHASSVTAVAVTANGQHAVSASHDNTVKLWNLETGEVRATFTCDTAARCCAYSDALKLIVAGDAGGHVHFLRLEEPEKQ